ncbi:MAG TPA: FtsX-like permease family protein [Flavobacteriaceae bacterium]|nr:FtsX-like permease family protein [Flavobacteriaceae bacterium]
MNFEFFISKRLIRSKDDKSTISAPIIKIAVSAIALGIIIMLIAFATSLGLQHKIREKISAFNGHISVSNFDNNNSGVSLNPISSDQNFYPEFTSVKGIEHVQAVATKYGVIRTEETFEGIVVKGVGTDYDWNYFKNFLVAGKLPNYSEGISTQILISEYIANRLGFKVGDKVIVYFMENASSERPRSIAFDISGIYNSGFLEFDKTYLISDIAQIQRINGWEKNQVGGFEIFLNNFDKIDQKGREIYEHIDSFLDAKTIVQQYNSIFEWMGLFDFNVALIIGIMILVSGMNMITALLVLILERTQMIGVLKALGSSDWSIRKIFLYNAIYLIVKGLFWGNVIGLGLLFLQKQFKLIPLNPETYYVTQAPVYLGWEYILAVNFGTLILCSLMLLIPSYIIAKISPVKVMKFD